MSVDHAFLDVLRKKSHAAKKEAMQGGIYVVSHQSTRADLGPMVRKITKCAGVNLEIIRDSIPCFVYFVVCAHNSKSFDRTVQIICETCGGAGFLFTIEQFIVIWECLMRHSGNRWMSAINDNGNLEFRSKFDGGPSPHLFQDPGGFDTDYYRKLFHYYYTYNLARNSSERQDNQIYDPAIITAAIENTENVQRRRTTIDRPIPANPVPPVQSFASNGGMIITNEEKLKDLLLNCSFVFKARFLKDIPGGVIEGIKTSTLTELLHFYNCEDKTDIFLITGLSEGCQGAIKQLHQIYGRSGIVYTTKQYFEILKCRRQSTRPLSLTVFPSYAEQQNQQREGNWENFDGKREDESKFVVGSIYRPRSVIIPCDYFNLENSPNHTTNEMRMMMLQTTNQASSAIRRRGNMSNGKRSTKQRSYVVPSEIDCNMFNGARPKSNRRYSTLDLLSRYRTSESKSYPRDWDYLVTIGPDIFTYDFIQERIDNYLNYWDLEEY